MTFLHNRDFSWGRSPENPRSPQMRRRDLLKPYLVFRDAGTGKFVTRLYALLHPKTTVSERRTP